MANTKATMDEIERQTGNLASAIEAAIADLTAQLATMNERYRRLTGAEVGTVRRGVGRPKGSVNKNPSTEAATAATAAEKPAKAARGKKRIRRTRDQLVKTAEDIMEFVRKGGMDGVKGSAIRAEFGTILPSIKEFVKAYGGKVIRTKGQKAAMTYHHD